MSPIIESRRHVVAALALSLACVILAACAPSESSPSPSAAVSPASPESRMIDAIASGDVGEVERLLADGVSPDLDLGVGGDPVTPLHRAASEDQATIIEVLIDAGATVDARVNGRTPLMTAAESGSPESVNALLEGEADPLIGNFRSWGMSSIHYAARGCNTATLQALVEAGVDIDFQDNSLSTAAHWSAEYRCPDNIVYLIEQGADLNLLDGDHATALAWAKELGFTEIVDMLAAAGGHE